MKLGSKDTYQRACDEVDRRLAAYRQLETDPAIDAELRRIIRSGLTDPERAAADHPHRPRTGRRSRPGSGNAVTTAAAKPAPDPPPGGSRHMTTPLATPATEASSTLYFGPWYRRSPFFEKTLEAGCSAYDIYNHMYLPGYYADPIEEYWALLNGVTVWDVSVERIVEITGPDASAFTNMLTCRDLTKCAVGQGKYMLVTAEDGGIVNDPVLLRDRGEPLVAGAGRLRRGPLGARRRDARRAWTSRSASPRSTRSRSRARSRRTSCGRSSGRPSTTSSTTGR